MNTHTNIQFREHSLVFQLPCAKDDIWTISTPRIGIHGIAGSFTDEALYRLMNEHLHEKESQYHLVELVESVAVLQAISSGTVDIGIFAFANSGSGGYLSSIQAMGTYNYEVIGLFTMPICMCLIVHPSIKDAEELTMFTGHPVALSQCLHTLKQRWPHIPVTPGSDALDTAISVQLLSQGSIPRTSGVFASERAASLYGMRVLAKGVHHDPNNATSFAVIRKMQHPCDTGEQSVQ